MQFVVTEVRVGIGVDRLGEIVFTQVVGSHDEAMELVAARAAAAPGSWALSSSGSVITRDRDGVASHWGIDQVP